MNAIDYEVLDPGIREAVSLLRDAGFETTDSGDGVSKPADWFESGEALPFPHVFAVVSKDEMFRQADRMLSVLHRIDFGGARHVSTGVPGWRVEASYCPNDGSCILMARWEFAEPLAPARSCLVIDHVVSRLNGGTHHPDNLQTLCDSCNSAKVGLVDSRHPAAIERKRKRLVE